MIQKVYKLWVLTILFVLPFISKAVTVTDSAVASNVQVCLKREVVRLAFSVGSSGTTGSYLDIKLPTGFTWEGIAYGPLVAGGSGSNTMTYVGVVGGKHRITFGSSTQNQSIRLGFYQKAGCGAGTSSFTVQDSLFFYEGSGSLNLSATNAFNGAAPSLSITSVVNTPSIAGVGVNVVRQYVVTNGGFGSTSNFILVDDFLNGAWNIDNGSFYINPSGVNYNISNTLIADNGDSVIVRFNPSIIQQIGDGDTLFENGESFVLNYTGLTMNCGDNSNNIISNLHTSWLCNGVMCTYTLSSTAISITVPSAPAITQIPRGARTFCTENSYRTVDTLLVRNSGGVATNLEVLISSSQWPNVPVSGASSYLGWFDTSLIRYKIGASGVLLKPSHTILATNNYSNYGCNTSNLPLPTRIRLLFPFLNTNDTLFIFTSTYFCTQNMPGCKSQTIDFVYLPAYSGLVSDLNYKNACGNISYSTSRAIIRPYEIINVGFENRTKTEVVCSDTFNIRISPQSILSQTPTDLRWKNAYLDIKVSLPAVLNYNSSYSSLQQVYYVTNSGSIYYPYYRPDANTFRFSTNNYQGTGEFVVRTVAASGGYCTSVWEYQFQVNVVMDSTICNNSNNVSKLTCVSGNFNYNSQSCIVCCPEGLMLLSSNYSRTTLGLPDNDNNKVPDLTGSIDTTIINRNYTLTGDTARITVKTLVKTSLAHTQWENIKFGAILPGGVFSRWDFIKATALIKRPSSTDTFMTTTSYTLLPGDSIVNDFSSISNLVDGDTVIYTLYVKDIMAANTLYSGNIIPGFWVSHSPNGQRFSCYNSVLPYTHIQMYSTVDHPTVHTISSCNQIQSRSRFLFSVGSEKFNGSNIFQNEIRNVWIPYSMSTKYPLGYTFDSIIVYTHISQGITSSFSYRNNVPFTLNGDSVVIFLRDMYQNFGGTIRMPDEGFQLEIYTYMKPSCKVTSGSTLQNSFNNKYINLITNQILSPGNGTRGQYTYLAPSFILNSTNPVHLGYTKNANWPITITNASTQTVPNVWLYIEPKASLPVDSVKIGSVIFTPDINGFFRLGTFIGNEAKNYTVYSKNLACNPDSLSVYIGYGCDGYPISFTPTTCNFAPRKLYIQPQPAAIQTQITSLASTPIDTSNASSSVYGSSTIYMCQSFPFEMELQATQPGNLYNVRESLTFPFNGGVGLDYINDSGYIEYPIGTTPRKFSSTANTSILSQISSGTVVFDLAQIDPTNFGIDSSLLGTGLGNNSTRRVKLRWKMKSNCNLVNGDQWQATQLANSPCGAPAAGNSTVTSGYLLSLTGVTRPYVANLKVSTGLDGCGSQNTQIRIEKIGAGAPQPTDSITVRLPKTVSAGAVTCSGAACPAGAIVYTTRTDALYQYITFPYPSSAGSTGDTLLYSFPMTSKNKSTCANNQTVKADVFQQLTIYCGSPIPANLCPNAKNSLGSETKSFDIRKAILSFDGYSSTYVYPSTYKYKFGGNVLNTSSYVATNTGVTLKTFMDVNNNLTYEKGVDALVRTTVISSAIPTNGSVAFNDSFVNSSYSPSPSLPMYTVIDTGDASANCFCGGVVQSAFNQALPIEFLNVTATNLNNITGKIQWKTNADNHTIRFDVYRRTENEVKFTKIGSVNAQNGNNNHYIYYDPISSLAEGKVYYQIEAVSVNEINKTSKTVTINKTGLTTQNKFFIMSPNPTNQFVKINLTEGLSDANIEIKDINGKVVYKASHVGVEFLINLSNLSQGVYTIIVESNQVSEVQKLSIVK